MSQAEPGKSGNEVERFSRRHLRFGWWSLLLFMGLGLGLEIMHGFKLGFYLDLENETRRFMWRLAHAHGVLLGLLQIAFAATLALVPSLRGTRLRIGSACLIAAGVLLPGGFFLGGVYFYGADPGLGILLSPLGAVLLLAGTAVTAWSMTGPASGDS